MDMRDGSSSSGGGVCIEIRILQILLCVRACVSLKSTRKPFQPIAIFNHATYSHHHHRTTKLVTNWSTTCVPLINILRSKDSVCALFMCGCVLSICKRCAFTCNAAAAVSCEPRARCIHKYAYMYVRWMSLHYTGAAFEPIRPYVRSGLAFVQAITACRARIKMNF